MMENIHVWFGKFDSDDALQAYFAETYDESETLPMNGFAADQGQKYYDHDWLERHFIANAQLDDLILSRYDFGRMSLAIEMLAVEQGISDANTLILADTSLIDSPGSVEREDYRLWFLGEFNQRMSLERFLDPKKTPPITDPTYWLDFPTDQDGIDALHAEADNGNYNAMVKLHLIYAAGINTEPDKKKAHQMFRRSIFLEEVAQACYLSNAEAGLPEAWLSLTNLHSANESGTDTERLNYLQRGAEAGILESQIFLSSAYTNGKYGLEKDLDQAEYWLLKAAEVHPLDRIRYLLYLVYKSRDQPGDAEKAFYWLREEAHATGNGATLGYLAKRYKLGEGIESDAVLHLMYLYLSLCQSDTTRDRTLRYIKRETEGYNTQLFFEGRTRARVWIVEKSASLARFNGENCDPFASFFEST